MVKIDDLEGDKVTVVSPTLFKGHVGCTVVETEVSVREIEPSIYITSLDVTKTQ